MNPLAVLAESPALWNRSRFDLRSDEILAQLMDRGRLADWRAIYALARDDDELRARIVRVAQSVPMYVPHLWLAAMRSLGRR